MTHGSEVLSRTGLDHGADRGEVEGPGDMQGPRDGPPAFRRLEAPGRRVEPRTATRQRPPGVHHEPWLVGARAGPVEDQTEKS